MNENYIPEEEEILTDSLPAEEPIPETPEAPESESAQQSESEETIADESIEMEPLTPDVSEDQLISELIDGQMPELTDAEAEVTDIIIEALAQQEGEAESPIPLTCEETEAVLEELTEEYTEETPSEVVPFDDGGEFQQMFDQKQEPISVPKRERPARKGRPNRKKGDGLFSIPHLLAAAIWLLIIVAIGVSLGRIIWVCAADVLAFGRENKEVTISITADDTMESIADKLHDAGLINIPELFLLYADLTDVVEENKITTGTFTLNTIYDYMALVNHMGPRSSNRAIVEDVLIPEGFSCRQIFALLEEKGICKAADLEAYAATGDLGDYWFLEGVQRGDKYCLEGFLFPDTYDFYENSTPKLALQKMLDGFEYRFTDEMKAMLPQLNERLTAMMKNDGKSQEFITENQLTLRDLITVASLIEEETASNTESYKIASVIYNRLYNWGSSPRYLNIDAALFYALGEHKSALTNADKEIDSPYNTYRYQGLVPGPISNPGLASIQAALNPDDTSYYYYVLNPEVGTHDFSKTLAEHEAKVKKYLGGN